MLRKHDVLGDERVAAAMMCQAADLAGDLETAEMGLAEAEAPTRPTVRLILSEVYLRLARAWLTAAKGELSTAQQLAMEAAQMAQFLRSEGLECLALHDVARFGAPGEATGRVAELAAGAEGDLTPACSRTPRLCFLATTGTG